MAKPNRRGGVEQVLRIGILGGSFDPVHRGHLWLAHRAIHRHRLGCLIFIPTAKPPHKHSPIASAKHRLRMLQLVLKKSPFSNCLLEICQWELLRRKRTYTYQTIQYLRRRFPKALLYLVLGEDASREFAHWKKNEEIRTYCHPAVFPRYQDFSSTEIRHRIEQDLSIHRWVPSAVAGYIRKHKLYEPQKS